MEKEEINQKILILIEDEKNFSKEFKTLIFQCDINVQDKSSWNGLTPMMYLLKWNHKKNIHIGKEKMTQLFSQVNVSIEDHWGYNFFHYFLLNKKKIMVENEIIQKLWENSSQKIKEKTFLKAVKDFQRMDKQIKTSALTIILYIIKDLNFHLNKKIEKKIKNMEIMTIIKNYQLYQSMKNDLMKKIGMIKKNKI